MKPQKHKDSKKLRWELVHIAGCTEKTCATNWITNINDFSEFIVEFNITRPVSVPKSLRRLHGRYITKELVEKYKGLQ